MRPLILMLNALLPAPLCCAQQTNSAGQWRQDIDALVSSHCASGTTVDPSCGIASRG